jgi:hypothetical protein
MNSYQTTNAAFVAAGQTAKEGVAHGVSYHAAQAAKFRFTWPQFRASAERQERKAMTFGQRYGTTKGFFDSLVGRTVSFDIETSPLWPYTPLAAPSRRVGKWNEEDRVRQLRQLALADVGRYPAGQPEFHGKKADMIIIDDIEPREPYGPAIAASQVLGTRIQTMAEHKRDFRSRDQSEDRVQPKFLVAGYGLHGAFQVLRRRDLKLIATYTGEGAAEQANNALDLLESAA